MIINSVSYKVNVGIVSSPNPKNESTIYRTFIDGSLSSVNYGARIDRTADLEIKFLTNTQFYTLLDYLIANTGKKVTMDYESADEQLWFDVDGDSLGGDVYRYYVYLLDVNELQEEAFSKDDSLYKVKLRVALAGPESDDIPNETDTANLNAFIEIDTLGENVTRSASAPSSPSEGDRWLDTSVNVLYERNSLDVWVSLYTVYADNADYGWVDGKFYLSAFADDTTTDTYKSGIINHNSIKFPGQSIDISKGPSISRKEGFTFALKNNDLASRSFWQFVIDNGINLFGAVCTLKLKYVSDVVLYATGLNLTNSFNYENYLFKIEPFALNSQTKIPDTVIDTSNSRYTNVKANQIGKAPYITYGTHQYAHLQDITTEKIKHKIQRLQYLNPTALVTNVWEGQIQYKSALNITSTTYISPGIVRYNITNPGSFIADVVAGDLVTITGLTNTNHNKTNLTVTSIDVSTPYIEVANSLINDAGTDEVGASGLMTLNTEKVYVRVTDDSKVSGYRVFDKHIIDSEIISSVNDGTSVIEVNFDSRFDQPTTNVDEVRKIINIDTSTNSDYYILTLDSSLVLGTTLDPVVATQDSNPRTRDYIQFQVTTFTYQYQIDEQEAEAFGVYSDNGTPDDNTDFTFLDDRVLIYTFDDKNRELITVPSTSFEVNAENNKLSLDPKNSAGANTNETFRQVNLINPTPIIANDADNLVPIYTEVSTINGFDFNVPSLITDLFNVPSGFNSFAMAASLGSLYTPDKLNPFIFNAITSSADGIPEGNAVVSSNTGPTSTVTPDYTNHRFFIKYSLPSQTHTFDPRKYGGAGICISLPINHSNDASFINNTLVKLVMKLRIKSMMKWRTSGTSSSKDRTIACGFDVYIRFRKKDGTYEYDNTEWKYEFPRNVLGVSSGSSDSEGVSGFDNYPDLKDSTKFAEGKDVLDGDPNVDYIATTQSGLHTGEQKIGDLYYASLTQIKGYNAGQSQYTEVTLDGITNDGLTIYDPFDDTVYVAVGGEFETASAGADYVLEPRMSGRDLIDLTGNTDLFGGSGKWETLEAMEILVTPRFDDVPFTLSASIADVTDIEKVYSCTWYPEIALENSTPQLYIVEEYDLEDKPLFSAIKGRLIDGVFREEAQYIAADVMDIIYPAKYDSTSLTNFFTGARADWKWRRQFTKEISDDSALKELLMNMWACATINEEDKLEFHALDTSLVTSGSALTLTDADIVKGSISDVKYRQSNSIYHKYELGYDYYIPSEFSSTDLKPYSKQVTMTRTKGPTEIQQLLKATTSLYNLNNVYTMDFKYHYEDLPVSEYIVKWMAVNSWTFKLDVAIETVITPTPIRLMSPVVLTSFFHTTDQEAKGFITSIKLNIYRGTATLGIYIPEPAGNLGPLCDPFNDALNISGRDISGWTDANGLRNDADQVSTRTLGSLTQKDANQISIRTFEC